MIGRNVLKRAHEAGLEKPLSSRVVLDGRRPQCRAFERETGAATWRFGIATAKPYGAGECWVWPGGRKMAAAEQQGLFYGAVNGVYGGAVGLTGRFAGCRDAAGVVIGALGVLTGDTSTMILLAALAGIGACSG